MAAVAPPGALERARVALRGDDFRKLFAIRIVGQGGDGFFTVALFASVVFNPSEHSTTFGLFKAALPRVRAAPQGGARGIRALRPDRARDPVLRRGARCGLDQPLLPRDGLGGRPATRAQRRSADRQLARDRRRDARTVGGLLP